VCPLAQKLLAGLAALSFQYAVAIGKLRRKGFILERQTPPAALPDRRAVSGIAGEIG
jgi:hypothetical protein